MKAPKEILNKMVDEMPFKIPPHVFPYIEEAMKLYAEESVNQMLSEKDKEIERIKHRIESIKQSAEDKLNNNNDRRLSESYIEASACVDVCEELLMLIAKTNTHNQ